MLNLSKMIEAKEKISKKIIYSELKINSSDRKKVDEDISRILNINEILSSEIEVENGKKNKSFYTMVILLKRKEFSKESIGILFKALPKNTIIILEYNREMVVAIYNKKVICSTWNKSKVGVHLELKGNDLDIVWENIIFQIKENKYLLNINSKNYIKKTTNKEIYLSILKKQKEISTLVKYKTVRALSIMPQYAHEILIGKKNIEYRTWKTDYRGDILICASSKKRKGTISCHAICVVKLADIHIEGYWEGKPDYGWDLEDVRLIKPFPVKGKLNIYEVDASLVEILAPINTDEAKVVWEKYYKPLLD